MWSRGKARRAGLAAGVAILAALIAPAFALDVNEALERAESVKKFQSTLASADKVTALVLVEEGLKSDDAQIVKIANEFALGNKDKDFQTLAVKRFWASKTNVVIRLIAPSKPTDQIKAFVLKYPSLSLARLAINAKGEPTAYGYAGSFTNGGFNLVEGRGNCSVYITDVTPKFMAGTYTCSGMDPIAARIDLE